MENNINKTETKKWRFNFVDAFLVITLIAVCFAVFYVADPFNWFSAGEVREVTLKYVVEIKGVNDDVKSNVKLDNTVFSSGTDNVIGKVSAFKSEPSYTWEYVEGEPEMVKKTVAGKSDLYITVETKCTYESGIGYTANGQQIVVGMPIAIRTPRFTANGYVVSIEEVK